MKPAHWRYLPHLLTMTLLFGLTFVATKVALRQLGVFTVVTGRYGIALVVFLLVLWKQRHLLVIPRQDWGHFLLLTFIEPVAYFILETFGIKWTSPTNVALMIATIPAFALLFGHFLLHEKATLLSVGGIVLSFIGVYFIVHFQEQSGLAPRPVLGSLLALGAAACAGLYNSLARKLSFRHHPLTITFYQTVIATLFFTPLALWEIARHPLPPIELPTVGSLVYLAVGSSLLGYFLLNFALSHLKAVQVAIFSNLIPAVTLLASFLVFGEMLTPWQLVGSAMVLGGVYFTFTNPPTTGISKESAFTPHS